MLALMEERRSCCEGKISHPWEKGSEGICTAVPFLQRHKGAVFSSCRWEAEAKINFLPPQRKPMVEQRPGPVSQVNALGISSSLQAVMKTPVVLGKVTSSGPRLGSTTMDFN